MKITDYDVIKSGEQELIDGITADLDWSAIDDIFQKEYNLTIEDNVDHMGLLASRDTGTRRIFMEKLSKLKMILNLNEIPYDKLNKVSNSDHYKYTF